MAVWALGRWRKIGIKYFTLAFSFFPRATFNTAHIARLHEEQEEQQRRIYLNLEAVAADLIGDGMGKCAAGRQATNRLTIPISRATNGVSHTSQAPTAL